MDVRYEMFFETTIRTFLGKKAYHIAGQVHTEKYRKEWYRKAIKKIIANIQDIDTTTKHKKQLAYWSEQVLKVLGKKSFRETDFSLCLLRLTGTLLGFIGIRGTRTVTPLYYQKPEQHYTELIMQGGDAMQNYYDQKSSVGIRKRIIEQLKDEGMSDFQISLVLNTTEYQVKKHRKEL